MAFDMGRLEWRGQEADLLPQFFDTRAANANLTNWISGHGVHIGKQTEEELLCREEKAHPDRFYVRTEPKKTAGSGVQPMLWDNQDKHYKWMHDDINVVSTNEHIGIFDKGFVLDAVVKANGRCFYYAVAIALSDFTGEKVEPGDVKRNVMKKLQESLLNPDLRFNQHALSFMDVEDYNDNSSRFAKWFRNEIFDVPRILNPMEADEPYHRRVMKCILQLEDKLKISRFSFLVKYFSHEVFEFACAFVMKPFLDAYPNVGISVWDMKHTCLSSGFTEPALQTPLVNHIYLMRRSQHFFLLRKTTGADIMPPCPWHDVGSSCFPSS